jgi:hypothetical protein
MSMVKVLWVSEDLNLPVQVRDVEADLEGLKAAIGGGPLEVIYPFVGAHYWSAYCDEEGKVKDLPFNLRATLLAKRMGWHTEDVLCGPVVFLGPGDSEGEETGVCEAVLSTAALEGILP